MFSSEETDEWHNLNITGEMTAFTNQNHDNLEDNSKSKPRNESLIREMMDLDIRCRKKKSANL